MRFMSSGRCRQWISHNMQVTLQFSMESNVLNGFMEKGKRKTNNNNNNQHV